MLVYSCMVAHCPYLGLLCMPFHCALSSDFPKLLGMLLTSARLVQLQQAKTQQRYCVHDNKEAAGRYDMARMFLGKDSNQQCKRLLVSSISVSG